MAGAAVAIANGGEVGTVMTEVEAEDNSLEDAVGASVAKAPGDGVEERGNALASVVESCSCNAKALDSMESRSCSIDGCEEAGTEGDARLLSETASGVPLLVSVAG